MTLNTRLSDQNKHSLLIFKSPVSSASCFQVLTLQDQKYYIFILIENHVITRVQVKVELLTRYFRAPGSGLLQLSAVSVSSRAPCPPGPVLLYIHCLNLCQTVILTATDDLPSHKLNEPLNRPPVGSQKAA